jgi:hypothetical protein
MRGFGEGGAEMGGGRGVKRSPGPVRCLAGLSGCAVVGLDARGGPG